jgi:uncharacterized glyoxalase superfamily protein PhnB
MTTARLTSSAPVLLVKDAVQAAAHWREKLGFTDQEMYGHPPDFCMVRRDGLTVMLAQVGPGVEIRPHWTVVEKMWSAYFWVDDAEALYNELIERGATIDWTLGVKAYGVKEFGIQDIDGHDIAFGQIL